MPVTAMERGISGMTVVAVKDIPKKMVMAIRECPARSDQAPGKMMMVPVNALP
jgi:hypothetical protein